MSRPDVSNIRILNYAVLLGAFVAGVALLPFNTWWSLLPSVVVFGWSQIGDL